MSVHDNERGVCMMFRIDKFDLDPSVDEMLRIVAALRGTFEDATLSFQYDVDHIDVTRGAWTITGPADFWAPARRALLERP